MLGIGPEVLRKYGNVSIFAVFISSIIVWALAHFTAAPGKNVSVLWGMVEYTKKERTVSDSTLPGQPLNQSVFGINNHWEATQDNSWIPDCSSHRRGSTPSAYTNTQIVCESTKELRKSIVVLSGFRRILKGESSEIPRDDINFIWTARYLNFVYQEPQYGPTKEVLTDQLKESAAALAILTKLNSVQEVVRWNSSGKLTVDDLVIENGFLEWIIGQLERKNLSPLDFCGIGPYYTRAFPESEIQSLSVRKFVDDSTVVIDMVSDTAPGSPIVKYDDLVGLYD